jgi:hypothetical protein
MQVSKILIVESPIHLWELMKNKEEIYENNKQLLLFFDFVQLLLSDCRCNHDENYKLVENQYNLIKNDFHIKSFLTQGFECDEVRFK